MRNFTKIVFLAVVVQGVAGNAIGLDRSQELEQRHAALHEIYGSSEEASSEKIREKIKAYIDLAGEAHDVPSSRADIMISVAAIQKFGQKDIPAALETLLEAKKNTGFDLSYDESDSVFLRLNHLIALYAADLKRPGEVEKATSDLLDYSFSSVEPTALRRKWKTDFYLSAAFLHIRAISDDLTKLQNLKLSPVAGYHEALDLRSRLIAQHLGTPRSIETVLADSVGQIEVTAPFDVDPPAASVTRESAEAPSQPTSASQNQKSRGRSLYLSKGAVVLIGLGVCIVVVICIKVMRRKSA